jgi:hypothetical protein
MFIKIKNNPEYSNAEDSFTIIDNVDVINYFSPSPRIITCPTEIKKLYNNDIKNYDGCVANLDWLYDVAKAPTKTTAIPTEATPYTYNVLNFTRKDDDEDIIWMFDTVAYIMSDEGKTIEKVRAGGIQIPVDLEAVEKANKGEAPTDFPDEG